MNLLSVMELVFESLFTPLVFVTPPLRQLGMNHQTLRVIILCLGLFGATLLVRVLRAAFATEQRLGWVVTMGSALVIAPILWLVRSVL